MWHLENLKTYPWEKALARASCPKCNEPLSWRCIHEGALESQWAVCCGHSWKMFPYIGMVVSDYEELLTTQPLSTPANTDEDNTDDQSA